MTVTSQSQLTRSNVSVDRKEAEPSMLASKLLSAWRPPPEVMEPPRGCVNPVKSSRLRFTALSVESMMLKNISELEYINCFETTYIPIVKQGERVLQDEVRVGIRRLVLVVGNHDRVLLDEDRAHIFCIIFK